MLIRLVMLACLLAMSQSTNWLIPALLEKDCCKPVLAVGAGEWTRSAGLTQHRTKQEAAGTNSGSLLSAARQCCHLHAQQWLLSPRSQGRKLCCGHILTAGQGQLLLLSGRFAFAFALPIPHSIPCNDGLSL